MNILYGYIKEEIITVSLQRHQKESYLATSLDADIPSINFVAEMKCKFPETICFPTVGFFD